jgi:RND family efflux transporter MFP subunit
MKSHKILIQFGLVIGILAGAAAAGYWFYATRPRARKESKQTPPSLVHAAVLEKKDHPVTVSAMGTVQAARKLVLRPEVVGRVTELSPKLVIGGRFEEGEMIVQIDPRDYELQVVQAQTTVATAEAELALEEGRRKVAREEWAALKDASNGANPGESALALREPQYEMAVARLEEARARLRKAKIDLERTTIAAPFNAFVKDESVEVGQLVNAQSALATLVGTDRFHVLVSASVDDLERIRIPGRNIPADEPGAACRITQRSGPANRIVREGRVTRLLGDMETVGRMARLVVVVDDPLALNAPDRQPLLVGAYVRVAIAGRPVENCCALPRRALREGNQVWICDENNRLVMRPVEIVWREEDKVYVGAGIDAGDRVILGPVPNPVPGMPLRVVPAGELER